MKFSTVCPIYKDRKQQLGYALKAYNDQDFDKNEFEVIIVDQGNDENIQELFSQYNINIQYIKVDLSLVGYEGARNPSYAQNVAIKKARGEYIVLTSPEVCFENLAFKKNEFISCSKRYEILFRWGMSFIKFRRNIHTPISFTNDDWYLVVSPSA